MQKNFRLHNLISGGVLYIPSQIKISYKLKTSYDALPVITVIGLRHGDTQPVVLGCHATLPDDTCYYYGEMTRILDLNLIPGVVDLWIRIDNIEAIARLYHMIGIFNDGSIPHGAKMSASGCGCSIVLLTFAINEGDSNTDNPTVTLNNTTDRLATFYRAGYSSDCTDGEWNPYSVAPEFGLKQFGSNRVYLQVKDQYTESNILSDTIFLDNPILNDEFFLLATDIEDSCAISFNHEWPVLNDTFSLNALPVSDSCSITFPAAPSIVANDAFSIAQIDISDACSIVILREEMELTDSISIIGPDLDDEITVVVTPI